MRCEAFYQRAKKFLEMEDVEGLEEFCRKEAKETIFRIRKYVKFWDNYLPDIPIGSISERALRPLIEAGDPDLVVQTLEKVRPMFKVKKKKGKKPRITSEDIKKVLASTRGEVYLTPKEKKELGSEKCLKETEIACDEFLAMESGEREALLKDLRAIVDLLGTWAARAGPGLRAKISPVRDQVSALRNELILFLPGETEEVDAA